MFLLELKTIIHFVSLSAFWCWQVYPRNRYASGLLAWTGNDVLNRRYKFELYAYIVPWLRKSNFILLEITCTITTRRLRILAESKGYVLDDTGLYLATQSSGGKRVSTYTCLSVITILSPFISLSAFHLLSRILQAGRSEAIVNCHEEKDVFDTLGFPYLEPHERNL